MTANEATDIRLPDVLVFPDVLFLRQAGNGRVFWHFEATNTHVFFRVLFSYCHLNKAAHNQRNNLYMTKKIRMNAKHSSKPQDANSAIFAYHFWITFVVVTYRLMRDEIANDTSNLFIKKKQSIQIIIILAFIQRQRNAKAVLPFRESQNVST